MSRLRLSCRIKINAAGDWQVLPPAGQIMQIGDAGATAWGLVNNDDLFVSGKSETAGHHYVTGESWCAGDLGLKANQSRYDLNQGVEFSAYLTEEIRIPVGQGAAGVLSVANLCRIDSIILGCVGRVTQAPGGGATLFDAGRNPIGPAEFAVDVAVALGTTFASPTDGDASNDGPVRSAADSKVKITTNANVTGSDMKVRVTVWYVKLYPPQS